ncbi:hypothetical protein TNCV_4203921 [Trichonephila clavipes]|nr:hypothetical protein TNCV_4203921 [Trichonephila clavipes]
MKLLFREQAFEIYLKHIPRSTDTYPSLSYTNLRILVSKRVNNKRFYSSETKPYCYLDKKTFSDSGEEGISSSKNGLFVEKPPFYHDKNGMYSHLHTTPLFSKQQTISLVRNISPFGKHSLPCNENLGSHSSLEHASDLSLQQASNPLWPQASALLLQQATHASRQQSLHSFRQKAPHPFQQQTPYPMYPQTPYQINGQMPYPFYQQTEYPIQLQRPPPIHQQALYPI